jgi:chloramphenicol 3-O-phosphotransferase
MATGQPEREDADRRFLLESMIDRVRRGRSLADLIGHDLDEAGAAAALAPLALADTRIGWLAVNGSRVDALVTARGTQWRIVFHTVTATTVDALDVFERPERFDGIEGGCVILLNGPSGAGKSMLMRALQQIAPMPLVVLDEPEHVGAVQPEYLIWRDRAPALHRGYLDAIGALARAGNLVATPAAGHRQDEFMVAFGDVATINVGLTCEHDVLVERERRTGRWAGISTVAPGIHEGWHYDFEFDTTDEPDPVELARLVLSSRGLR